MIASEDSAHTATQAIVEALRERIVAGDLRPHAKLTQRDLADQFGVSAMPVRDAIKQLISDGLVVAEGQKTIVVAPMSADDFLDVMEMRLTLEPRALELAMPFISAANLSEIEGILASSAPTDTSRESVEKHWRFHQTLYRPSRRQRMLAAIEAQHLHLNRYLLPNWALVGVGSHWAAVEVALLDLIKTKRESEAIAFLRDDIEKTIVRVLRVLRS